uniref:Uncharacterized protein n=1 Tax=Candidatus Kentrum sp. FW TaxID=2126338 RepID=A0A450TX57_9GAMM|nr:MAG: hypothetical protein BECKFW1821C_GA0114237_105327 [Candidatus Kentron sp. FW]
MFVLVGVSFDGPHLRDAWESLIPAHPYKRINRKKEAETRIETTSIGSRNTNKNLERHREKWMTKDSTI